MNIFKKFSIFSLLLVVLVSLSGCGCKQATGPNFNVNLEIWGLFENDDAYQDIFSAYIKQNPSVSNIVYKKMDVDSYKRDLVEALASGQGPDIFLIHNNWVPSFNDKLYPAPEELINEQYLRKEFVDVVADDFFYQGKTYALPLSVDSLGLYYNRDLFNAAGITSPPKNWDEFVDVARKLTKYDEQNQIIQSGAAMGTSSNINRPTDILNLLMLQNNTQMVSSDGRSALFDKYVTLDGKTYSPGENALHFYTQFANRSSQAVPYTWNPRMHYSIDAFSEGTLGMMFNYSWQREVLDSKAPKLNYEVAPVPQFPQSTPINYANYWAYSVAKNRIPDTQGMDPALGKRVTNDMRAKEAWKFLIHLTTNPQNKPSSSTTVASSKKSATQMEQKVADPAKSYLEKTKKPAARRDLIELQKTDAKYGVFAQGNLIAKNWFQIKPDEMEALFSKMISKVNNGETDIHKALEEAALAVTQMMDKQ